MGVRGSSLPGQSSLLQTHWLFRQMLVEREAQVMGGSAEAGIHERIWRGHRHPTAPKEGYGTRKSQQPFLHLPTGRAGLRQARVTGTQERGPELCRKLGA